MISGSHILLAFQPCFINFFIGSLFSISDNDKWWALLHNVHQPLRWLQHTLTCNESCMLWLIKSIIPLLFVMQLLMLVITNYVTMNDLLHLIDLPSFVRYTGWGVSVLSIYYAGHSKQIQKRLSKPFHYSGHNTMNNSLISLVTFIGFLPTDKKYFSVNHTTHNCIKGLNCGNVAFDWLIKKCKICFIL